MTIAEAALEYAKEKGYSKFEVHFRGKIGDEKSGVDLILIAKIGGELKLIYQSPPRVRISKRRRCNLVASW